MKFFRFECVGRVLIDVNIDHIIFVRASPTSREFALFELMVTGNLLYEISEESYNQFNAHIKSLKASWPIK